jgi:hypothetical protein
MRQFMCYQLSPGIVIRTVLSACEHDIGTQSKGPSVYPSRQSGGTATAMNSDPAEIMSKSRFKEVAAGFGKWLTAALQRMDNICNTRRRRPAVAEAV